MFGNWTEELVTEFEEYDDGCPFDWNEETDFHVSRWNGKHQDGQDCDFKRSGGCLVRVKGEKPARDDEIMFGKHKGTVWSEIPSNYLSWVAENVKGSARKRAAEELKRRKIK